MMMHLCVYAIGSTNLQNTQTHHRSKQTEWYVEMYDDDRGEKNINRKGKNEVQKFKKTKKAY